MIIRVQVALTLIGAGMFGFGVLQDSDPFRMAAIGTLVVALVLRFVRQRATQQEQREQQPPG